MNASFNVQVQKFTQTSMRQLTENANENDYGRMITPNFSTLECNKIEIGHFT